MSSRVYRTPYDGNLTIDEMISKTKEWPGYHWEKYFVEEIEAIREDLKRFISESRNQAISLRDQARKKNDGFMIAYCEGRLELLKSLEFQLGVEHAKSSDCSPDVPPGHHSV